ncbi:hypothetical protein DPMN_157803 [Dreissena polymorpha]|uniref:Uncharacterized protein n=1 Tax=Dreissena polymorpha TaxID=45954 RepID=A0A9D4EG49_DREPO|nr:hypothetical protein DPMN_157803 [Dreissena polymorpha]
MGRCFAVSQNSDDRGPKRNALTAALSVGDEERESGLGDTTILARIGTEAAGQRIYQRSTRTWQSRTSRG